MADLSQQEIDEALRKLGQAPPANMSVAPTTPAPEEPKPLPPVDLPPVQGAPEIPSTDKEEELAVEQSAPPAPSSGRTVFDAPVDEPEPVESAPPATQVKAEAPEPTPAPAPEPAEKPAATQAAPGVTVVVQPPQSAEQPQHIEDVPFNQSAPTRTLRAQEAATDAREIELRGQQAQTLDQRTQDAQKVEDERARTMEGLRTDAELREGARKERAEETRARMAQEIEDLKAKMGTPPKNTVGIIMGLVSALAASQGKGGLAAAFQALGTQMNSPMRRWQAEMEAGKEHLEGMGKLIDKDRLLAADEQTAHSMIDKAYTAELAAAADFVEQNAKNQVEADNARVIKNGLINKRANEEIATRQKAEAAALRARVRAAIDSGRTPEERVAISKRYGEIGGQELQKGNKAMGTTIDLAQKSANIDKTDAEIGKVQADAVKAMADAAETEARNAGNATKPPAGGQRLVKGWVFPPHFETSALAKEILPKAMAGASIKKSLSRLGEIADGIRDGTISKTDRNITAEVERLRGNLVGQQTNFFGQGSPTGQEFQQTIDLLRDPTKWFQRGDSSRIIDDTIKFMDKTQDAMYREVNALPEAEWSTTYGGQPASSGPAFSEVRDRTGKVIRVPTEYAEAGKKTGDYSDVE